MDEGTIYRAFGRVIADKRRELGKTQQEVAEKLGLSRASLANIERGEQRVFLHQILAFVDALELESAYEIVPARAVPARGRQIDMSMSGDRLNRNQERAVRKLLGSIAKLGV